MNPTPLRSLTRPAAVPSLAKDARSARVIGRPLCGRNGHRAVLFDEQRSVSWPDSEVLE